MISERSNIRLQALAFVVSIILMAVKFFAYFVTNSNAILSDAFESIINVVAGAFALYSIILAAKPRDRDHPYGHGKVEFLSAGLEGALIIIAGIFIIGKSFYNFFIFRELQQLELGILLIAISGIVNFGMGKLLEKRGLRTHSQAMSADGKHLLSDAYSTFGLLAGLMLVYFTGLNWLDNVVAILFGIIIIITGFKVLRKSISGIMDEADFELLENLIGILNQARREEWIDIHNLRAIKYGPVLHVDCHVTLPWYYDLRESHDASEKLAEMIRKEAGRNVEFFIHNDPCVPDSCKICRMKNCAVRQHDFEKKIEWNLETVLRNSKHRV